MSNTKLTQEDVQQILGLIESADHVAEFHLKFGDVEVGISRANRGPARLAGTSAPAATAQAQAPNVPAPAASAVPGSKQEALPPGAAVVKAPMVGTFYRAPAPGAAPFVEIGQKVEPDTTVCIIEVMKLMNSISAGVRGTVTEIRVADSQPVEFGQVLIVMAPDR